HGRRARQGRKSHARTHHVFLLGVAVPRGVPANARGVSGACSVFARRVSSLAMVDPLNPTLKAVSDAVLAVAAEVSVEEVLQRLVESARELAGARYAALGLPDGEGGFRQFLTAGMSEELVASLGPLPRQHGVLGAMLEVES